MFYVKTITSNADTLSTHSKINTYKKKVFLDRTLYKILRRKQDGISAERQKGSGKPAKIMTKSSIKQLL